MSGLGTKSDNKQKRMEALALAGSMKSENARRRQALVQFGYLFF